MNKTIFITGASSGLGKATAKLFAEKGWTVFATMRNPEKEMELLEFSNIHLLKMDISNPAEILSTVHKAEIISSIDVLFNNAGYVLAGSLESISDAEMEEQFQTNFFGTIRLTKAILPYFRAKNKGLVLTTTSLGAYIPDPFMSLYSASKAALENWSAAMSYEMSAFGIEFKTIIPGFMKTNFVGNAKINSHLAYDNEWNKVMSVYADPNSSANADYPNHIAEIIYKAATDNKKQLRYFAGNDSTTRYGELTSEGIDTILDTRKNMFFKP